MIIDQILKFMSWF